jgi:hypothetical protein
MRLTAALMALYLSMTAALAVGVDRRFLLNDVIALLIFSLLIGGMVVGARWSESPPPDTGPDEPPPDDGGWTPPPAPLPSSDWFHQSPPDDSRHRAARHGDSRHRGDELARHRSHRSHQHRGTGAGA